MYYILIKRQIIRLSNGISNIKMGKRMLLKINQENEKRVFFLKFLASDISLNNLFEPLKLSRHGVKVWKEGTVSQIIFKCPSFCFMKSRKKCFKNTLKVSRFLE